MIHRLAGVFPDKVQLCNAGGVFRVTHEDLIPEPVFWRITARNPGVPGNTSGKDLKRSTVMPRQSYIRRRTHWRRVDTTRFTPKRPVDKKPHFFDTPDCNKFAPTVWTRIIVANPPTPPVTAMKDSRTVGRNKVVTMQYSLTSTTGVVVREASGAPVSYLHGTGNLFPKLEQELENHGIGDIVTARLLADDAFGKRNLDLVQEVPLEAFPPGEKIEIGGQVVGAAEDGTEVAFSITDIRDGIAHLDGNHPLAGQSLVFEVEIQGIRDATDEEIRLGKSLD